MYPANAGPADAPVAQPISSSPNRAPIRLKPQISATKAEVGGVRPPKAVPNMSAKTYSIHGSDAHTSQSIDIAIKQALIIPAGFLPNLSDARPIRILEGMLAKPMI